MNSFGQFESNSYPSLEEMEDEHGYLQLTEEDIIGFDLAELRQLIVEQDTDGFIEAFSEEYETGGKYDPRDIIKEFMRFFFNQMNKRKMILLPDSIPAQNAGFNGTWDFDMDSLSVKIQPQKIKARFRIRFMALIDDTKNYSPINGKVQFTYHFKKHRWKIKSSTGFFSFFRKCITCIYPGSFLPIKFLSLYEADNKENKERRNSR